MQTTFQTSLFVFFMCVVSLCVFGACASSEKLPSDEPFKFSDVSAGKETSVLATPTPLVSPTPLVK